jgi:integrase
MARPRKQGFRVLGPYKHRRRWRIELIGTNGRRTVESFSTEDEAEKAARNARSRAPGGLTVGKVMLAYEHDMRRRDLRPRSIEAVIRRLGYWLDPDMRIGGVTERRMARAYERRCDQVAAATHQSELSDVKTFFRWCVDRGHIRRSPAESIRQQGRARRGKPQLRRSEARAFVAKATEMADAGDVGALCALAVLMLGLRSSEILLRLVRDVDVGPDGVLLWIPAGKTEAARRWLEVPEPLAKLLAHQAADRRPEEQLIPSEVRPGGARHRNWLLNVVKRICKAAGVPLVCVHGLRGTWATLTADAGVSAHVLARDMGHTGPGITRQHYIEPGAEERARTRRLLRVLNGGRAGGETPEFPHPREKAE